jgi:hypothetical protein
VTKAGASPAVIETVAGPAIITLLIGSKPDELDPCTRAIPGVGDGVGIGVGVGTGVGVGVGVGFGVALAESTVAVRAVAVPLSVVTVTEPRRSPPSWLKFRIRRISCLSTVISFDAPASMTTLLYSLAKTDGTPAIRAIASKDRQRRLFIARQGYFSEKRKAIPQFDGLNASSLQQSTDHFFRFEYFLCDFARRARMFFVIGIDRFDRFHDFA